MRGLPRRWWLLMLAILVPVVLYPLANLWLESAGGRGALEQELARRAGLPVRLLGEFDIMLFPAPGVEGTELVIGGSGEQGELVRSGEYSVALALRPLLAGELRVLSVRLAEGALRLDRLPASTAGASREPGGAPGLPAVDELTIIDFLIVMPGEQALRFKVDELNLVGFAEGRDTTFSVVTGEFGQAAGRLRWDPAASMLTLDGAWSGYLSGDLEFRGQADFRAASGSAAATWSARPAEPGGPLALTASFAMREAGVRLDTVELTAGEQSVLGSGCFLPGGTPALRLELTADVLDLDQMPELPSFAAAPAADDTPVPGLAPGLDLDIRLAAREIHTAGAVARQAVLSLGGEPDCGELD